MKREELIQLRKRLGLKQITVARMANIERSRLSCWENGHVEMAEAEVIRVANVLAQELELIRKLQLPQQVTA